MEVLDEGGGGANAFIICLVTRESAIKSRPLPSSLSVFALEPCRKKLTFIIE